MRDELSKSVFYTTNFPSFIIAVAKDLTLIRHALLRESLMFLGPNANFRETFKLAFFVSARLRFFVSNRGFPSSFFTSFFHFQPHITHGIINLYFSYCKLFCHGKIFLETIFFQSFIISVMF